MKLVWAGCEPAIRWCKFMHYLPWSWAQGDPIAGYSAEKQKELSHSFEQREAERLHVIAVVTAALPMRAAVQDWTLTLIPLRCFRHEAVFPFWPALNSKQASAFAT